MAGIAQLLQTLGDVNVSALADGKSPEWNAAASEFQFVATVSIDDAGTTTDAWSAAKIIAYVSNRLDGLDYQADVLDIQVDATLDPGATPTTGDRYIITDSASLHANFGTITGIGDNDIVEYDGADFVVIYDVSVEGEGAIVWDRDSDAWKKWTGTTWSDLTTAGESNTASNVGASGIGIFEQKTGVDLELRKVYGLNGIVSSLNSNVVELKLDFPGLATRDAIDTANDKIAYYSDSVGEEVITDIENFLSYYVDTTPSGGGGDCCLIVTKKTANYTATAGDLVVCDATSGAFAVTLPAAPTADDVIGVYLEHGSFTLAVTIEGNGKTLGEFGSSIVLRGPGEFFVFQYDGAKWIVTAQNGAPMVDGKDHFFNSVDTTKRLQFDLSSLAASKTVSLKPAASGASATTTYPLVLNNLTATTAPTASDDSDDGYAVSSIWVDVTADKAYVCVDATPTAAVWNSIDVTDGLPFADGVDHFKNASDATKTIQLSAANVKTGCQVILRPEATGLSDGVTIHVRNHHASTAGPSVNDDQTGANAQGSLWYRYFNEPAFYVNRTNSTGVAQWDIVGVKMKIDATTAPGTGDDILDGFVAGSIWIDTTNDEIYVCVDSTQSLAIWRNLKVPLSKYDATTAPGTGDDSGDGYEVGSQWFDVTADDAYVCLDATAAAAVWKKTTP